MTLTQVTHAHKTGCIETYPQQTGISPRIRTPELPRSLLQPRLSTTHLSGACSHTPVLTCSATRPSPRVDADSTATSKVTSSQKRTTKEFVCSMICTSDQGTHTVQPLRNVLGLPRRRMRAIVVQRRAGVQTVPERAISSNASFCRRFYSTRELLWDDWWEVAEGIGMFSVMSAHMSAGMPGAERALDMRSSA